VLLFVALLWALYLLAALWREYLWRQAGSPLLHAAGRLGLTLRREPGPETGALWAGYRAVITAEGRVGARDVRVSLRGGLRGARVVLRARGAGGDLRRAAPLEEVGDLGAWLDDALGPPPGEE